MVSNTARSSSDHDPPQQQVWLGRQKPEFVQRNLLVPREVRPSVGPGTARFWNRALHEFAEHRPQGVSQELYSKIHPIRAGIAVLVIRSARFYPRFSQLSAGIRSWSPSVLLTLLLPSFETGSVWLVIHGSSGVVSKCCIAPEMWSYPRQEPWWRIRAVRFSWNKAYCSAGSQNISAGKFHINISCASKRTQRKDLLPLRKACQPDRQNPRELPPQLCPCFPSPTSPRLPDRALDQFFQNFITAE